MTGQAMTYCVGILVRRGLVLAADSRTNAGVDHTAARWRARLRLF